MEEVFLTVLNMSLTASYVILFIMLLRLPLKKAPKVISYALWSVAAFRLLCPFSFESVLSLLPINTSPIPQDIAYRQTPQINSGITTVDTYVNSSLPAPVMEASANPLQIYTLVGTYIWLLGIVVMLAYSIISVLILKNRLKCSRHTELNIHETDNLKTPFVLGVFRPRIFIPAGLTAEEKNYILWHEQTHIRRYDHIVKLLAFIILSIHWFNPMVWVAFVLMSTDMELSCDERVIREMGGGIKKAYSASLLSLASGRHILNGSPLAFGEGNVKVRIKNALNYRRPAFWVIAAAIIAVAAVSIGLLANPKDKIPGKKSDTSIINNIQVEITEIDSKKITGKVVTDKADYKAGDKVTVAIGETVAYDMASLKPGDWINVGYCTVMEIYPPEFAAIKLSTITDDYPTSFTLFDSGKIVKSNILKNSFISLEMPSLLLRRSPVGSQSVNDVPYASRYLKIDIGSGGDKIYYTYEKGGKCYIEKPYDTIYEVSREIFDELTEYVYKNEITDEHASQQTSLKPTAAGWSRGQTLGVDMASLDYASDDIVILHGYFGLFVYDLNSLRIIRSLDLKPLKCDATQGDNYCEVSVSVDGNTVQLHPMSSENMYIYTVSDNTLRETAYKRMSDRFGSDFVPIEDVIDLEKLGLLYSFNAVKFSTSEYGYLHTTDWTLGALTYIRDDMIYKLFDTNANIVYSEEEIQAAMKCVRKYFSEEATSRVLNDLWFNEEACVKNRTSYMQYGKGKLNGVSEENVIVLLCNFTIKNDKAFEGYYPNWHMILIRDSADGAWRIDGQGV